MEEKLSESQTILKRLKEKRVGEQVSSDIPKVSIIIPAYNISTYVGATLKSVFAQTYTDFEVVVVNDGSEDRLELERNLEPFFDKIVYGVQENEGAAFARNLAIALSRGSLVAFLDGDDIWFPDYLKKQLAYMERNELDMVYSDAEFFGESYSGRETYMQKSPSNGTVTPTSLINATCNVATSSTVLKQEYLRKFGLFDSASVGAEDFDLWFRLAKNGVKIGYQKDALIKYRVSSTSLSGSSVQRAKRNVSILRLIKDKYELTDQELYTWEIQMNLSKAEVELEKGKLCLIQEKFPEAIKRITKANEYYKKPKLALVNMLLRLSPKLALNLFKRFRSADFSFISSNQKT